MEHHEKLYRKGFVQNSAAGQLFRALVDAAETGRRVRVQVSIDKLGRISGSAGLSGIRQENARLSGKACRIFRIMCK